MKTMNTVEMQSVNAGAWKRTVKCCICKKRVTGGFWTQYKHCLKHSAKGVMTVVNFVGTCFGLAAF